MEKRLGFAAWTVLTLLVSIPLVAEVEVTPFVGFQAGGGFDTREGDLNVDPSANLGLVVSIRTRHDGLVEFLYSRQPTTLELDGILESGTLFDLNVEYFHFGGLWEIETDNSRPFLGMTLGATHLDPEEAGFSDEWAFSAGISGGAKFFFTERLAARIEGRGMLTLFSTSGAIFCGFPPGQCGLAVTGSSFAQISALIGLTYAIP